jgi:hypothetical protein
VTWTVEQVRLSTDARAVRARRKRAKRREAKTCINGTTPATNGRRCVRCTLVHRYGIEVARGLEDWQKAPLCNPPKAAS